MKLVGDMGGFPRPGVPVIVNPRTGFPFGIFPVSQELTAAGGETFINLLVPTYGNSLQVFKNGILLNVTQITRNSAHELELSTNATGGDVFTVSCLTTYGQAIRVAALIPAASDPDFASRVALLHFLGSNGTNTYTDVIGNVWTAGNGATISTAHDWFGLGSSGDFAGGSNKYISCPDSAALRPGTQDFLIEWQMNFSNVSSGFESVVSKGYVSAGDFVLQTGGSDGKINVYLSGSFVGSETTGTVSNGVDYFMRFYRYTVSGTQHVVIERNGVATMTVSGGSAVNLNGTDLLGIGARSGGGAFAGNALAAYIGEFRYTIGIYGSPGFVQSAAYPDF